MPVVTGGTGRVHLAEHFEVKRDENGRLSLHHLFGQKRATRATAIIPNFHLITRVLAFDIEFQRVLIHATGRQPQRIGRISVVNENGEVIYDVFVFYPEEEGYTKVLSGAWRKFGVYWPDIKLANGAVPIEEVEVNLALIFERAEVIVGHDIGSDIKVCPKGLFHGLRYRDTQLYEPYRVHGIGRARKPKLSVLATEILHRDIQGEEHSSVEDAVATMDLYLANRSGMNEQQKDWVIEEGNRLYNLGWEQGLYEEYNEEEEELFLETDETADYHVDTSKLVSTPLTEATSFWKKGSKALVANMAATSAPKQITPTPPTTTASASPTAANGAVRELSSSPISTNAGYPHSPSSSIASMTSSRTSLSTIPSQEAASADTNLKHNSHSMSTTTTFARITNSAGNLQKNKTTSFGCRNPRPSGTFVAKRTLHSVHTAASALPVPSAINTVQISSPPTLTGWSAIANKLNETATPSPPKPKSGKVLLKKRNSA